MTGECTVGEQQRVMGVLAHADPHALAERFDRLPDVPAWHYIRPPETGLVMVRGRIAAEGAPFNFGEATVTRAVVSLDGKATGFAYALGRDAKKAEQCAVLHAMWQCADYQDIVESAVVTPLEQAAANADAQVQEEVAATKVDFFTMMRGDD